MASAGGQVLMVSPKRNRVMATLNAGGPLGFDHTIAVGRLLFERGREGCRFYTCDLTYEYVRLNADYTT